MGFLPPVSRSVREMGLVPAALCPTGGLPLQGIPSSGKVAATASALQPWIGSAGGRDGEASPTGATLSPLSQRFRSLFDMTQNRLIPTFLSGQRQRPCLRGLALSSATLALAASTPAMAALPGNGESTPPAGQLLQLRCDAAVEATGVIGRTVAFHTDGDGRLDLIAKVSDELIWVTAPDPLQHSSTLGLHGVTAFTPLERVHSTIGALIVAHGGGVEYIVRDLDQRRVFSPIRTPLGGAGWVNARSLVAMDVDGDGDADILGLSADGTQLLRMDQVSPEAFVEQPAVDLGVELDELRAIQWGASGSALAAILRSTSDSACVIGADGTLLRAESFGGAIDDIVVVDDAHAAGEDGLAVLSAGSVTLLRPGMAAEAPVNVSPVAPTSMSAADLDGDGRADLLLNSSTVDEVTALLAQDTSTTGGPIFVAPNASTAISIPLEQSGASMGGQLANPVGADFDRDGDIDVFQLIESTRGACVQRNALTDETMLKPRVTELGVYPGPVGATAILTVDSSVMPDGLAPDQLEVTLSTLAAGAEQDAEEQHCLHLLHDAGSVTVGNGDDQVTLDIPCHLGDLSTLLIRGLRLDPATGEVASVGVEMSYRLIRVEGPTDGSLGDYEKVESNSGKQGTPPPAPPTPIDPFA